MKVSIKRFLLNAAMLATVLMLTNAHAGDIAAGKAKSATCVACHGVNGKSSVPMYQQFPPLAETHQNTGLQVLSE